MVTHPEDRCEKEPYVVSYSCCSPYLSSFIYLNSTTCLPHCSQRNSEEQFWSCHSSTFHWLFVSFRVQSIFLGLVYEVPLTWLLLTWASSFYFFPQILSPSLLSISYRTWFLMALSLFTCWYICLGHPSTPSSTPFLH